MEDNQSLEISIEAEGLITKNETKLMFDPFNMYRPPSQELQPYTIFRMPVHIRKRNKVFCRPQVVSIGPYNRSKKHLQAMEVHKQRYLADFLSRNPFNNSGDYLKSMQALEGRARKCYFERPGLIDSKEFAEMLLLDGSFIIESLIKEYEGDNITDRMYGGFSAVAVDLIKLENQIPFFVLENLFALLTSSLPKEKPRRPSLVELVDRVLVLNMLQNMIGVTPRDITFIPSVGISDIDHLLHLCHHCTVSRLEQSASSEPPYPARRLTWLKYVFCWQTKRSQATQPIPCATALQEAGVTFQKKESNNILDISFRMGVLEMPTLLVNDTTTAYMTNLMAFEECLDEKGGFFSTYAIFMDRLIDTSKDVSILEQCGIIRNMLASPNDVVLLFNNLTEEAKVLPIQHAGLVTYLFSEIPAYCEQKWHSYRERLMRDYFNNPWTIISFIAATVLLVLTILQTFYTVFPYYHPRS